MLKLAAAFIAALLVLSPALASNKKQQPSPAQECLTPDALAATAPTIKIEGERLDIFRKATGLPKIIDLVMIVRGDPTVVVIFVKGCAQDYHVIPSSEPSAVPVPKPEGEKL